MISSKFDNFNFIIVLLGSSDGKESIGNAGDPGLIPAWEDSLQKGQAIHSSILGLPWWQAVKNLPAMWETLVQSLDWKDSLEEGMATHSSILAQRNPMDRRA